MAVQQLFLGLLSSGFVQNSMHCSCVVPIYIYIYIYIYVQGRLRSSHPKQEDGVVF